MPVDSTEQASGLEPVGRALDELRASHDEFEDFFGDVFDELQSLSRELFARQKCLDFGAKQRTEEETAAADRHRQFRECLDAFEQAKAGLGGELGRLRSLLDNVSGRRNEHHDANTGPGGNSPPSSENAVLGSVLAQFETLQRERAQRKGRSRHGPREG